jgi:hypothetical protein
VKSGDKPAAAHFVISNSSEFILLTRDSIEELSKAQRRIFTGAAGI